MIRKLFLSCALFLIVDFCFSQQNKILKQDTAARQDNHQVKTVNSRVIKLDKPVNQNNQPLPPMKSRKDTLMYLIQQHKQNKANTK